MSFSINAGEIKAAVFPTGVTQAPKPSSRYAISEAGTLLCTVATVAWGPTPRDYTKTNDGRAYVAYWDYTDVGRGPLLVSETKEAVTYSIYKDGSVWDVCESEETFYYKNKTWYHSGSLKFEDSKQFFDRGVAEYIGEFASIEDAARHLLDLVYG